MKQAIILVNFGGPRNLEEVEAFLRTLLTDRDVVRSKLPSFLHNILFKRVAKKRAVKVAEDYALIGGKSPIYEDTEAMASALETLVGIPVLPFHRYLPKTHPAFLQQIVRYTDTELFVFPLFPQFSYATTGSIARWFRDHISSQMVHRLRWTKSYAAHPAYVQCMQQNIRDSLVTQRLKEEDTILLFSAHGLPQEFVDEGDIYETECRITFEQVVKAFPRSLAKLCYQSKFGPGEWLKPYTDAQCENILEWHQGYKNVLIVPLSFTSDHIETLFEIEYLYLPLIRKQGLAAFRCPAFNLRPDWIETIAAIIKEPNYAATEMLIRHS